MKLRMFGINEINLKTECSNMIVSSTNQVSQQIGTNSKFKVFIPIKNENKPNHISQIF